MARTIGLRDISFAELLTDIKKTEATYGPVKKYERSVSAKLTPKTNSDTSKIQNFSCKTTNHLQINYRTNKSNNIFKNE